MNNPAHDLFDLDDRLAVVSGGAGLIGAPVCEILAWAGARVVIVDVQEELGRSEAERISAATGREVTFCPCDITSEESVVDLASDISLRHGAAEILVNAAHYKGGSFFQSLNDYPKETWDKVVEVNLTGMFLMSREFGSRMFESDGGSIVNFSSTYGVVSPDPRIYGESGIDSPIAYAATKGGILNMTRYLAVHWRPKVRANILVPGGVEAGQDLGFIDRYQARTPLGRMAHRTDYQGAILFMVSDASRYMTGSTVTVDGGWTSW